ncbi:hypothetical protein OLNG_00197 [Ostreococcus lucimarinus virus OlV5]|uniref:hypothetical protein n=1 Tax=Ostreococcus lucimarinus virus OlV5 TaxID=754064 RepID=UPI0002C0F781|nr:hypothetical protein OLNG_00197 [Ostreococcus lucimarinus virus OlV5]AGH31267.1 hypothetical protein OLNG_00197 [Ostreococcus lucimarinus virus OlV5]
MQTKDTIDIKKELEVLRTAKKELSEQLLKIEGIESYYENLIKKNIVIISEPIQERNNINLKKY